MKTAMTARYFCFLLGRRFAKPWRVSRIGIILGLLLCGLLAAAVRADTFKLSSGETAIGELLPTTANDQGVKIKTGEGEYQQVSWGNFSQEDLKKLAENPKLEPLVTPYIEINAEEKRQQKDFTVKLPPRLERPPVQSLAVALFSSGLGVLIVLGLYLANIYAGYEIARFRYQPLALVCGVSAVLPLIGPVVFLALPGKEAKSGTRAAEAAPAEAETMPTRNAPSAGPQTSTTPTASKDDEVVNPMQSTDVKPPSSVHLAHSNTPTAAASAPQKPTIYQRGQFTFNRRFFETKFSGFFGVVRRDPDRDMVLVIKAARGEYVGHRISQISASDLHLQIQRGPATEDIRIPFQEIQEIRHQHKDA
jgi:hypothetical protein